MGDKPHKKRNEKSDNGLNHKPIPSIPTSILNRFEYAQISIPIAILIRIMIYQMMLKKMISNQY
ncbi:MAG: hypothetical protein BZ138_05515 [Methanosphaera sp. rholeuAM270]|nr:MAG: hypothetical protein BZ138_05515 [Methanosphaera sp. rholeuAM270]